MEKVIKEGQLGVKSGQSGATMDSLVSCSSDPPRHRDTDRFRLIQDLNREEHNARFD